MTATYINYTLVYSADLSTVYMLAYIRVQLKCGFKWWFSSAIVRWLPPTSLICRSTQLICLLPISLLIWRLSQCVVFKQLSRSAEMTATYINYMLIYSVDLFTVYMPAYIKAQLKCSLWMVLSSAKVTIIYITDTSVYLADLFTTHIFAYIKAQPMCGLWIIVQIS